MTSAPSGNGTATALARAPEVALARYASFPAVLELIRANRDVKLLLEVETHVRLVHYAPGRIEFEPVADAPRDLAATLAQRLQSWTGVRWGVSVVSSGGTATIAETRDAAEIVARDKARENPLVQAVFAAFPEARITTIRTPEEAKADATAEALAEVEDEWDPFEEN
jgi:DNA polymerase III subunit gamma/tau